MSAKTTSTKTNKKRPPKRRPTSNAHKRCSAKRSLLKDRIRTLNDEIAKIKRVLASFNFPADVPATPGTAVDLKISSTALIREALPPPHALDDRSET